MPNRAGEIPALFFGLLRAGRNTGANAEGAEVTQRTQRKYRKWVWGWGEGLALCCRLPAFLRRAWQLETRCSQFPSVEGYAAGGGWWRGWLEQRLRQWANHPVRLRLPPLQRRGIFTLERGNMTQKAQKLRRSRKKKHKKPLVFLCVLCVLSAPSAFGSRTRPRIRLPPRIPAISAPGLCVSQTLLH